MIFQHGALLPALLLQLATIVLGAPSSPVQFVLGGPDNPIQFSIIPNSMPRVTRTLYCNAQTSTCGKLCGSQAPRKNDCDPHRLSFNCLCANGTVPGLQYYTGTLPTYMCRQAYKTCIVQNNDNLAGQAECKRLILNQCGTLDPSTVEDSELRRLALVRRETTTSIIPTETPTTIASTATGDPSQEYSSGGSTGISGGVIAGIVIGSIVILFFISLIVVYIISRRLKLKPRRTRHGVGIIDLSGDLSFDPTMTNMTSSSAGFDKTDILSPTLSSDRRRSKEKRKSGKKPAKDEKKRWSSLSQRSVLKAPLGTGAMPGFELNFESVPELDFLAKSAEPIEKPAPVLFSKPRSSKSSKRKELDLRLAPTRSKEKHTAVSTEAGSSQPRKKDKTIPSTPTQNMEAAAATSASRSSPTKKKPSSSRGQDGKTKGPSTRGESSQSSKQKGLSSPTPLDKWSTGILGGAGVTKEEQILKLEEEERRIDEAIAEGSMHRRLRDERDAIRKQLAEARSLL